MSVLSSCAVCVCGGGGMCVCVCVHVCVCMFVHVVAGVSSEACKSNGAGRSS